MSTDDRRPVSTTLSGSEWGALDRYREAHGHGSIAETLRHLVRAATDDHDHLLSHAARMGDAGPLVGREGAS